MKETVLYDGGVKCIACDKIIWLVYELENHHFPITKNHGGNKTIPLCVQCHSLIDRIPFSEWPLELSQFIFSSNMPAPMKLLFLKFWKLTENMEYNKDVTK